MKPSRPICAHCGKPYGRRDVSIETVKWPLDKPMPEYRGNGIVLKTGKPYKTTSRATVRGVTMLSVNPEIRAWQEGRIARAPEHSEQVANRDVWDGVSWTGGYDPFCTLRCALDYARRAYNRSRQPLLKGIISR